MQGGLTVARAGERLAALERKVAELESEYAAFGLYGRCMSVRGVASCLRSRILSMMI
ncbi:MAG: hypothetical protein ACLFO2_05080 [Candidatus Woesearchaeota archaeon]